MATTERDELNLDDLLAEARKLRPVLSDGLRARILADAQIEAQERLAPGTRLPSSPGAHSSRAWTGWLNLPAGVLGGWPTMGGLAACTVLGLVLGVTHPAGLAGLTTSIWGEEVSVTLGVDEDPLSILEG